MFPIHTRTGHRTRSLGRTWIAGHVSSAPDKVCYPKPVLVSPTPFCEARVWAGPYFRSTSLKSAKTNFSVHFVPLLTRYLRLGKLERTEICLSDRSEAQSAPVIEERKACGRRSRAKVKPAGHCHLHLPGPRMPTIGPEGSPPCPEHSLLPALLTLGVHEHRSGRTQ